MKYAHQMIDIAIDHQEKYAETVHDVAHVKSLIDGRSHNGYRHMRIYQKRAITLEDTRATKTLVTWLNENGFTTRWDEAVSGFDASRPRSVVTFFELVISWQG